MLDTYKISQMENLSCEDLMSLIGLMQNYGYGYGTAHELALVKTLFSILSLITFLMHGATTATTEVCGSMTALPMIGLTSLAGGGEVTGSYSVGRKSSRRRALLRSTIPSVGVARPTKGQTLFLHTGLVWALLQMFVWMKRKEMTFL